MHNKVTEQLFEDAIRERLAQGGPGSPKKGDMNDTGRHLLDEQSESAIATDSMAETFVRFGDTSSQVLTEANARTGKGRSKKSNQSIVLEEPSREDG